MDFRYYLNIFSRRVKLILAVTALFIVVSGFVTKYYQEPTTGALIFVSVGVQPLLESGDKTYNPRESAEASDRFSETVQGWIKNPDLIKRIEAKAGTSISISARKQEKQNLLIDLTVPAENLTQISAQSVLTVLNEEIANYNSASKSSFIIALNSINPYRSLPNLKLNLLLAFGLGLFVSLVFAWLDEYARGVVSFTPQVEKILGKPVFAQIKKTMTEQEISLISGFLNSLGSKIIVAGVGIDASVMVLKLVSMMAKYSPMNVALLDFDLKKRNLHRLTNLIDEKLLGVTDLSPTNISSISDYFKPIAERVTFLPAGQGTSFNASFVDVVSQIVPKVMIYSTLPDNPEVLSLPANDLCLLIFLGKTKQTDLEQIKAIFKGNIQALVIF